MRKPRAERPGEGSGGPVSVSPAQRSVSAWQVVNTARTGGRRRVKKGSGADSFCLVWVRLSVLERASGTRIPAVGNDFTDGAGLRS